MKILDEATRERDYRQAKAKIATYIRDNGLEFTPDCGNVTESKHYPYCEGVHFGVNRMVRTAYGVPFYFRTDEDAHQTIDALPDEWRTLLS